MLYWKISTNPSIFCSDDLNFGTYYYLFSSFKPTGFLMIILHYRL